jgi:hypothetical protein
VLCLRNDRRLGVHNGTLATITAIDAKQRAVTIRTDTGTVHELPARYLDAGHLTHGYAMTIHKSQGLTVDRCLVLATDTLDHNAGYTALSRGKTENRIYLHGTLPDPEAHHPDRHVIEPRDTLATSLSRDRSDRLAIDHISPVALHDELRQLHRERAPLLRVRAAMPPSRSDEIADLTAQRDVLSARAAEWRRRVEEIRPGLVHRRERLAERLSAERSLDTATHRLDGVERALDHEHGQQRHHLEYRHRHGADLDRLADLDTQIDQQLERLVDVYAADPPEHLRPLGPYPTEASHQQVWRYGATVIERYRTAHEVTEPATPLGPQPRKPAAVDAWRTADRDLRWVVRTLTPSPERGVERGIGL